MKLDIYITNPEYFCRGGNFLPYGLHLEAHGSEIVPDKWIFWQTIELDETLVDTAKVLEFATAGLDAKEKEIKAEYAAKMAEIEKRRGELLALEHKQ